jgi:DNA-binding MarR family transcriptional regulator
MKGFDMSLCACANIRRVDRTVTQFYEEMLAPSGLHITQFTLLVTIAESAPITVNHLAEIMGMDRTTLTRALGPLTKQSFVSITEGEDRRTRLVTLTQVGEEALEVAFPLWEKAQSQVVQGLGQERFYALLTELSAIATLSR